MFNLWPWKAQLAAQRERGENHLRDRQQFGGIFRRKSERSQLINYAVTDGGRARKMVGPWVWVAVQFCEFICPPPATSSLSLCLAEEKLPTCCWDIFSSIHSVFSSLPLSFNFSYFFFFTLFFPFFLDFLPLVFLRSYLIWNYLLK